MSRSKRKPRAVPRLKRLSADQITHLAKKHKIADTAELSEAIDYAKLAYKNAWRDVFDPRFGPSSLDKLSRALPSVIELMRNEANKFILRSLLPVDDIADIGDDIGATRHWLDNLARNLEIVQHAAQSYHPPPRPLGKKPFEDLHGFVEVLAVYWRIWKGPRQFTNDWETDSSTGKPIPKTDAARFIYDVMEMINPDDLDRMPHAMKVVRATTND